MDSDDFDGFGDDIADEDLVNALTQASEIKPTATLGSVGRINAPRVPSRTRTPGSNADAIIDLEGLDDFPCNAFESSPVQSRAAVSTHSSSRPARSTQGQKASASQSYRQTNLWGDAVRETEAPQSQIQPRRVYRADIPPEAPTHHALDHDALKTWVYPTNLGAIRDYQFSIVNKGLFNNTLVALPTGLGKTFIAATIILNYFRWTKTAKIIFVAPTKPLAAQQVEACMNVAGIPRSQAILLTGEISPALREGEWEKRRLFFMTPQTLQNDLSKGYADPKAVVLLVIDEAHRATGDYAYVKVVEFLRRFNPSFRILALTATPGSTVEGVQAVIDSLGISTVEIRMEESIDIRQYVHSREVEQVVLKPSDEMLRVQDLFSKALEPLCNKIAQANKWVARDPMTMTVMGLREAQRQWGLGAGKHANPGIKFMIMSIFTILQSLAHAIKLLNFHGIAPFYHKMLDFRSETEEKGAKGSKYRRQVLEDADFQEMMDTIDKWQRLDGFVGHPKLSYLCEKLLNHFMDRGQESNTRAIVFSEYRDSAEEIVRTLNKHRPMIKATIFVGQADSKRSEGMKQKQQIETIERFRNGQFNVLVATSIGEEGLDIGQVDLIVCYDASASPIRMLQRMGRTGRKRAGSIMLLLMKGKEEESFRKAKDSYEKMQRFICEGKRFNFRDDLSSRIIPRDIKPVVDKRLVEIPIENTQDKTLPEPKKASAPRKKATQKKFHMPDGVITGFVTASNFGKAPSTKSRPRQPLEIDTLAEVPRLDAVLLDPIQTSELDDTYRNLPSKHASQEDIMGPDLTGHPKAQRKLGPNINLQHGRHTKRCVKLFKRLANSQSPMDLYHQPYGETDQSRYTELPVPSFADDSDGGAGEPEATGSSSYKRTLSPSDSRKPTLSKRRKCGPKARDAPQQRSKGTTAVDRDAEDDFDSDPFADEDIEGAIFQPMPEKERSRGKAKGRRGKTQANMDFVEDYGDDCTRTSQLYERDDSDDGADLLDFVVADDDPISSLRGASTSPTATSPPSLSDRRASNQNLYEVLSPTRSQASDEDMPSMSQMGGPKSRRLKSRRPVLSDSDGEDGDVQTRSAAHKRRRRANQVSETESE